MAQRIVSIGRGSKNRILGIGVGGGGGGGGGWGGELCVDSNRLSFALQDGD